MVNGSSRKAWIAAGALAVAALLGAMIRAGLQGGAIYATLDALLETVVSLCVAGSAACLAAGLGFLRELLAGRPRRRSYVVLLAIGIGLVLALAALRMITLQQETLPAWQFVALALDIVSWLVHWFGLFLAAFAALGLVVRAAGARESD